RRSVHDLAGGRARYTRARRALRAGRSVPDDARAGPRTPSGLRRRGAGGRAGMSRIDDYRRFAGPGAVDFVLRLARPIQGRRVRHVTGGRPGGGAGETLRARVPILGELGIDARWEVTGGDAGYYMTARALQAALEGAERGPSEEGLARWADMNRLNGKKLDPGADLVSVPATHPP